MFEGNNNPMFFIGVVEDNVDPQHEGRIRVRAFGIHGLNDKVKPRDLPWAICASGSYDPNDQIPPLNSFVYGVFLDGRDAQHPLILGLIPAQFVESLNPTEKGWGVIPAKHGKELAKGSTPKDFGQHPRSRLARGEDLKETYILQQEMSRVEDIKIANSADSWDEPSPAYKAQYPFNRVIETSKHSIEIDDTPNAERIMIRHKDGSYIQISAGGTTAHKSTGDKYDVTEGSQHVFVAGCSHVHIENDCTLYVNGNMSTEVAGSYKMNIKENAEFSVGGQLSINASDQLQLRSAEVKMESNVSNMSIFSAKDMKIEALDNLNQLAPNIKASALLGYNIQAGIFGYNLYALGDINFYGNNIRGDALGLGIGGGSPGVTFNAWLGNFTATSTTWARIDAPIVTIDKVVSMASGFTVPVVFGLSGLLDIANGLDFAQPSGRVVAPEPTSKSTSITRCIGSKGVAGATASFRDV